MKELTIEQKAQRYDKVLMWMRDLYPTMEGAMKEDAEHYFPELTERENEKIIKSIIRLVKAFYDVNFPTPEGFSKEDIIDWLIKRGEQNHIEWSEEDDVRRRSTIQVLEYARSLDDYNQYGKADIDKNIAWLERPYCNLQYKTSIKEQKETSMKESHKYFSEEVNSNVQYASIEGAIKAHAETYSFNIESKLFHQLTGEQQKLWRKEIEQAVISGGEMGVELTRDMRYKENLEMKEMNLEKEYKDFVEEDPVYNKLVNCIVSKAIAKHFFELGLKAQKGE